MGRKAWVFGDAWDGRKEKWGWRIWVLHSLVMHLRKGTERVGAALWRGSREWAATMSLWDGDSSALVKGCHGKGLKVMSGGRLWHISSHAMRMSQFQVAWCSYIYVKMPSLQICFATSFILFVPPPSPPPPCTLNVCMYPQSNILLGFLGRSYWCSSRVSQNSISTAVRVLSIKRLIIYVCPHLLDKTVDSPWAGRVVVCFAWSTQGRLWKAVAACGCCYSLISYINRYLILNFNFKIFFFYMLSSVLLSFFLCLQEESSWAGKSQSVFYGCQLHV